MPEEAKTSFTVCDSYHYFAGQALLTIIIIIIVYYAEAAKPYNTMKHSKNTVKNTEMYKT